MPPRPDSIRDIALSEGFDLVAFGPADPGEHGGHFERWLAAGRAGEMRYLADNRELILDPRRLCTDAKSTVTLAYDYGGPEGSLADGRGRVARYAVGRDYHRFLGRAMQRIRKRLEAAGLPRGSMKIGTDAVPILERALAARAGLGFLAKSAGILDPRRGPYLLLSEVLTRQELPFDPPSRVSCGTCTACLEACPTGAIVAPYEVDARKCLSYTTIELRGFTDDALRRAQGDRLFGCDVCLEVCPFAKKGRAGLSELAERPADLQPHRVLETYDLHGVLELSQEQYETDWTGTAMRRATRSGLRRNAAVVLGNLGDRDAVPALSRALGDADAVVRGHAAWALGRMGAGRAALENQLHGEDDPRVQAEIRAALDGHSTVS